MYSRFTVVGVHFLLSAAILGALLTIMLTMWYPNGLFSVAGGWQGLRILAPIDLVLGPVLTLLFYRPNKRGVARDLALIACVQLGALGYGAHAVYQQRPVALVFAEGEFIAITPADQLEANKALRTRSYVPIDPQSLSAARPAVVVARPVPREEYGSYVASLLNDMPELAMRSDRYEPVSAHADLLVSVQVEQANLDASGSSSRFRLKTKFGSGWVEIDLEAGRVVASAPEGIPDAPQTRALHLEPTQRELVHNPTED